MNDYLIAILLGVIEGFTEFLPISSTGHLLLTQHFIGVDLEGDSFWKVFTVVIQLGAILAVVVYYRGDLIRLARSFILGDPTKSRWKHPAVLVVIAFMPAAVAGVIFKDVIDEIMETALPVAIALILGAVAIELIERRYRQRGTTDRLDDMTPRQALGIGIGQMFSLIPGVSRSAATIMSGLVCGLTAKTAADFSFLLSIPTMLGASTYSLLKYDGSIPLDRWFVLGTGFLTAFVVALAVVVWFLRFVRNHSFRVFVVYRLILGTLVLVAWGLGWVK